MGDISEDDDILDLGKFNEFEDVFESLTLSNETSNITQPILATTTAETDDLLDESPPDSMIHDITHSTSQESIHSLDSRCTLQSAIGFNTSSESLASDRTVSWKQRSGSFRQRLDERRLDEQRLKKSNSLALNTSALPTIVEGKIEILPKIDSGINVMDETKEVAMMTIEPNDSQETISSTTRPPMLRSSNNQDLFSFQTESMSTSSSSNSLLLETNNYSKTTIDHTPKKSVASRLRPPTPSHKIASQHNSPTTLTTPVRKTSILSAIPKYSPSKPTTESPNRVIGKKYNSVDIEDHAIKYRKISTSDPNIHTNEPLDYILPIATNSQDPSKSRIAVIASPTKANLTTAGVSRLEQLRQKYSKK